MTPAPGRAAARTSGRAGAILTVWPLAGPLLAELLLGLGVGALVTVLAARLSDTDGAAYAVSQHVLAMLFVLFRVVGAGVSVVLSQSLGAGRSDRASRVASTCLAAGTWGGLACALAAGLGAHPWLGLLQTPPEVRAKAAPLLMACAPALVLDAWLAVQTAVLRSHLLARPTMRVVMAMQVLLLLLAFVALPRFGLLGFALALTVSRVLAVTALAWLWRTRLRQPLGLAVWWRIDFSALRPVLRIGVPGAAENIAWRLAFMVSVAAAGHMGAGALATQAYALQVSHIVLLVGLAIGLSMEVLIGRLIGAGQLRAAHSLLLRSLATGWVLTLALSAVVAVTGDAILRAFTRDEALVATGAVLLMWTLALEPGRTFNLVVINALRAAGDVQYPLWAGISSMVVVLAGGSWLLGVVLDGGLVGVWVAYAADEWVRGLLMWRRWVRLGWVPAARRAHRRARQGAAGEFND